MCGIVGIGSSGALSNRDWLTTARDLLKHRGPDDAGEWWSPDGRVGMAHRRLAILDLTPAGHQPMHLKERGLSIVFNGELYNFQELRGQLQQQGYVFCSTSDTEVLLAAYDYWGQDCVSHFNGMFAFVIYDANKSQLFLARDRAGEKPLFYCSDENNLYFTSELKALLSHSSLPRRIDPEALDCFLAMGFVPGDRCILSGYNKLPPAHALIFNLKTGESKVWRYWSLPEFSIGENDGNTDEVLLLEELDGLLADAVSRQLVADVPVGILLSGGVDSSLVTAMAVRHSNRVRTFTIGFPGQGQHDESSHARLVAGHFGTDHTELMAEPTVVSLMPDLARQFDEPIVDSSMIPTLMVSNLVRQHCTVALGGDGGDELFGGYEHYRDMLYMQRQMNFMPLFLREFLARVAENWLPIGLRGRNWLQRFGADLTCNLPTQSNFFDVATRNKLLSGNLRQNLLAESIQQDRTPDHLDLLQRATRYDFKNYLAEDILVKVDRASMVNSLEVRSPFLDRQVIEFAFGRTSSCFKATLQDKKILLKQLAARLLPPEFDRKRKQGFSIPLAKWLEDGPFRELFCSTLLDPGCIFDLSTVQGLIRGQERGRSNSERLFSLVLFELWRKENNVAI